MKRMIKILLLVILITLYCKATVKQMNLDPPPLYMMRRIKGYTLIIQL